LDPGLLLISAWYPAATTSFSVLFSFHTCTIVFLSSDVLKWSNTCARPSRYALLHTMHRWHSPRRACGADGTSDGCGSVHARASTHCTGRRPSEMAISAARLTKYL
jgi:hypothetical protein